MSNTQDYFEPTPTILIVDDTITNLNLLSGMLRDRGYEPRPLPSGKLALAAAHADPPDLILLDIKMPEMDGFEVCRRLKEDEALKGIPVIFITALSETADKIKAFSLGAVDYVTKPFQMEEVEARVRAHLKIQSLQRQLQAQNEGLERMVAERTRELAKANQRLLELSRLKNDFLGMISYEMRTPANGVLGIGELILDLCPDSEEFTRYSQHFQSSSKRLLNLIEDATMIADMEKLTRSAGETVSLNSLLAQVQTQLPEHRICFDSGPALETVFLKGDPALLIKALNTLLQLATFFAVNKTEVRIETSLQEQNVCLRLHLDALTISQEQAAEFFNLESPARCTSSAESLGLAPVVAQKIMAAFGGNLKVVKGEGQSGSLEALFQCEPVHI